MGNDCEIVFTEFRHENSERIREIKQVELKLFIDNRILQ